MAVDLAELGLEVHSDKVVVATDRLDELEGAADRASGGAQRLTKTSSALSRGLATAAKYAAGFVGVMAAIQASQKAFAEAKLLDSALAETSTLIEGTAAEMQFLEETARSMGREFGTSATSQVKSFYQAISAGAGSVEQAAVVLESANKLAIGGVTQVATAVDVLTSATNAYARTGLTAAQASDALFVGIKAGKTTADELASALGQVIPISSALNVSFDETVAAVAALTTQGQSTAQAVTGVRGALAAVLKPTAEATELAAALGLEFNSSALSAKGFAGFLQDVTEKTGGNQDALAKLFGGIEGLNAVLALTSGGAEKFAQTLVLMEQKTGATEEAFRKMDEAISNRLDKALARLGDLALSVGQALLVALVPALEAVVAGLEFLVNNFDVLASVMVAVAATQIPGMVVALVSLVTNFGLVAAAATGLSSVMTALGVAMTLAGGPIGILLALIAGGAAYFLVFRDNAKEAETGAYDAAAGTEALNSALGVFYGSAAPSAGKAAIELANANVKLAETAYDAAEAEYQKQIAMNAAAEARLAENGAAMPFGTTMGLREEADAADRARVALESLQKAREDQKRAVTAVTGSDFSPVSVPVDQLGRDITSILDGLGLGGAGSVESELQTRLDTLMQGLQTEREMVEAWRQEGLDILTEAREQGLIDEMEYKEALLRLEEEYQQRKSEIASEGLAAQLGMVSDFFDDVISLSGSRNSTLVKMQKTFAAAEALVNTYRAAAQALADPSLSYWQKFAAVAKVIAAGMGLVNAIRSGGGGSAGGRGGRALGTRDTSQQEAQQPLQVRLEGFDSSKMYSGDMLSQLFDQLMKENKKRGYVIVTA